MFSRRTVVVALVSATLGGAIGLAIEASGPIRTILLSLLSAAIGAGAAILGAWWSAREQRRQWRDDLRLEAYANLSAAARDVLFKGHDVGSDRYDGNKDEQIQALREAMWRYRVSHVRVRLVGPKEVSEVDWALHTYLSYCLYTWFENRTTRHPEGARQVIFARDLIETFDQAAEEALRMSDVPPGGTETIRWMRSRRSR